MAGRGVRDLLILCSRQVVFTRFSACRVQKLVTEFLCEARWGGANSAIPSSCERRKESTNAVPEHRFPETGDLCDSIRNLSITQDDSGPRTNNKQLVGRRPGAEFQCVLQPALRHPASARISIAARTASTRATQAGQRPMPQT
jgi:hypothetical protein